MADINLQAEKEKRVAYRRLLVSDLIEAAERLLLTDKEWEAATKRDGAPGVSARTIYRMRIQGKIPFDNKLAILREALLQEADNRGYQLGFSDSSSRPVLVDRRGGSESGSGDQAVRPAS